MGIYLSVWYNEQDKLCWKFYDNKPLIPEGGWLFYQCPGQYVKEIK